MSGYASMSPAELVAEMEQVNDARHEAEAAVERAKAAADLISAHLMMKLGDGEAIVAPSGRVVFKDVGPLGSARVNQEAITEHAERLPAELQPQVKQVTSYPSVSAVRKAAHEKRLPDGLVVDDLLVAPPSGSVLRWRSVGARAAA